MAVWIVLAFAAGALVSEYYNRRIQRILRDRIQELRGAKR